MTREEAIKNLQEIIEDGWLISDFDKCKAIDACEMAIKALEQEPRWIPVSERLPEDFGTYLITLENGDVCWCDFNPDYIDEEHDNGAFTYYHDYYDNYTLGLIDSEECVVDAIAWRTLEPYKEESEE